MRKAKQQNSVHLIMMQTDATNNRYIVQPKQRIKILYENLFVKYVKKYALLTFSVWMLSLLANTLFDPHMPFLVVIFVIALLFFANIEYDASLLTAEKLFYNNIRIIKAKNDNVEIPNSLLLLSMPFIDNIIKYIQNTKKHNLLFKTSLFKTIEKNSESREKQEIIFYTCNFCTRLILNVDVKAVIVKEDFLTFDIGFMNGLKYSVIVTDENGNTLDDIPKYKIECIKETISKSILGEDIDIFCYNNAISLFDFLNSFFFMYWLAENYLLYAPNRKILV
jgi:hypothetical protein